MEQLVRFPEEGSSLWQNMLKRRISLFAVPECSPLACLSPLPEWHVNSSHFSAPSAFVCMRKGENHNELHHVLQLGESEEQEHRSLYNTGTNLACWPQPYCCVWRSYHHSLKRRNIAFYDLYCSNPQESQAWSMNHITPGTAQMKRRALAPDWRPFVSQGVTWPQT